MKLYHNFWRLAKLIIRLNTLVSVEILATKLLFQLGLEFCSGSAVVIIDGDLQDPPELIPKLYDKFKGGL